jgi:hypothetical protein
MQLAEYESRINRGGLHFRSKRLDKVVGSINAYVKKGSAHGLLEIEKAIGVWRHEDPKEYTNRGKPSQAELEERLREEGAKWGLGRGRIRLVDPSSNPRYEPHVWNDNGRIQLSTNCYAYACNDPYHHAFDDKPQPGTHMLRRVNQKMTNEAVRLAVMQDDQSRNNMRKQRLIPLIRMRDEIANDSPIDVVNVPGYYLIALVVARNRDYHWYRQDDTGLWSHKPGHTQATNVDASGQLIYDPRDCNLGIYSFTTFYFAPKGGVRTASLGDWTNPNWHA